MKKILILILVLILFAPFMAAKRSKSKDKEKQERQEQVDDTNKKKKQKSAQLSQDNIDSVFISLRNENERVKRNYNTLRHSFDSIKSIIGELNTEIYDLRKDNQELSDSLVRLNKEIVPLKKFRVQSLLVQFSEFKDALSLPYSQINSAKLYSLRDEINEFSSERELKWANSAINRAIQNKEIFSQMQELLNQPYDNSRILKAIDHYNAIKNSKLSESQAEEFKTYKNYLLRYKPSLLAFQDIIKKTNEIRSAYEGSKNPNSTKDCISEFKDVLSPYEQREIKLGIYRIPYLKTRFEMYHKWAMSDPLRKPENIKVIEGEILSVVLSESAQEADSTTKAKSAQNTESSEESKSTNEAESTQDGESTESGSDTLDQMTKTE